MSEFKGTQGPWIYQDKRPSCEGFSIFSGSQFVAFVGDTDGLTAAEVNAHLIAAAPDLLEALEKTLLLIECADETGYVEDIGFISKDAITREVIAAIAKAKGEQQ